jgi:hypothetical protein
MEKENKMMLMMVFLCLVIHYKVMIVKKIVKPSRIKFILN